MADEPGRQPGGGHRARTWLKPWVVAAWACAASWVLVSVLGAGRFRSEFLGVSLILGIIGGGLLLAFRALRGPAWMRWLGVFGLNWLFAAYAISFLAV